MFVSCKSVTVLQSMEGEYQKSGKDYKCRLNLNRDSSFILTQKYFEVNSICNGKWQNVSADTILLKCDVEDDITAKLQSGYMTERENKVLVLNKNRLKIGNVVLKRIKK